MMTRSPIIALVDDDKIFQAISAQMIQSLDPSHRILQFGNGEEALHYLKDNISKPENLPDYIFLDINMPVVDGWMFLADYATIKSTFGKQIRIFVLSSSIDSRDIVRAQNNSDVLDYILKPVTTEKFREIVVWRADSVQLTANSLRA